MDPRSTISSSEIESLSVREMDITSENKVCAILNAAVQQRVAKRMRVQGDGPPLKEESMKYESDDYPSHGAMDLTLSTDTTNFLIKENSSIQDHASAEISSSSHEGTGNISDSGSPIEFSTPLKKYKKKPLKCPQCDTVCANRPDLWRHKVIHIPEDIRLYCSHCEFVTEHRHHLQYHIQSNHVVYKPFKCAQCSYQCINKSMLNSHIRSHLSKSTGDATSFPDTASTIKFGSVKLENDYDEKRDESVKTAVFIQNLEEVVDSVIHDSQLSDSPDIPVSSSSIDRFGSYSSQTQNGSVADVSVSSSNDIINQPRIKKHSRKNTPRRFQEDDSAPRIILENGKVLTGCVHCSIFFLDYELFIEHQQYHSPNNPYTCFVCKTEEADKFSFSKHLHTFPH